MKSLLRTTGAILVTIFYSIVYLIVTPFDRNRTRSFAIIYRWAAGVLKAAGIKVLVKGEENLQRGAGNVYISNHASLLDIPALIVGLRDDIRIMYKRELQKIPLFGWGLKRTPFISVDRSNPRDGVASIQRSAEAIREGGSVAIFAEGTRSPDGKLGRFKRGAFILATQVSRPIVPVTIVGSSTILQAGATDLSSGVIQLIIHKPISSEGIDTRSKEKELMHDVRASVAAGLPEELQESP